IKSEKILFREVVFVKYIIAALFFSLFILFLFSFDINKNYILIAIIFVVSPWEAYSYHFEANLKNDLLVKLRVTVTLSLALI
ncbi:hypothetical protein KZ291_33385, partial [Escherichia coli]|nr:hypothetical protein [Escherichia coli]